MKIENQKKNRILKKILKKILLIIILLMVIYNLSYFLSSMFNKKSSFLGIKFFVVSSNSMKPTLKQKDLIITKKTKAEDLKQDDIIVYLKDEDYRITRIINTHENKEVLSYVIKGDNNYYAEQILGDNIQGRFLARIPMGGIFINILRSKILTVIILICIILLYRYKRRKRLKDKRRRELKQNKNEQRVSFPVVQNQIFFFYFLFNRMFPFL